MAGRVEPAREKYNEFVSKVSMSGIIWGIWTGEVWATADDPSRQKAALFMLWDNKKAALDCLSKNITRFAGGSFVDTIELDKWINHYTGNLTNANAAAFLGPDNELKGLIVDPVDLRRDLIAKCKEFRLQGSDLTRIRAKSIKKLEQRKQKPI